MTLTTVLLLTIFAIFIAVVFLYSVYSLYAIISGAPFVPTKKARLKKMIKMANLKPTDKVVDLGSGEGRITIEAAKYCAKSIGVEINPSLYWISKIKARGRKNIKFKNESLWKTDLSDFDLVFIYFIPHRMEKLAKKIKKEMKPGSRIISHAFAFPDWQYLQKDDNIYLYEI
ncbi:MAG: class I SAM-dependent methyltransferase [Candidatus Magasanikbacteria bacterium]|jgi:cyclopropane fatty-acyl-phospholipid synthase-like methyltransferase|nr:class I SAM-dependent methyltransferase [Candidatus Magasanikbacteria bacterium]MBT4315282.1 class I SAM-dependent methyltransferase [Candidatus Magasanikbacteria bacterium]MBT4547154.1 class I SAM-dependent methyltransferase [Candidatus Magasanikbacteria bacterium]MBT6819714.1 class I SAM-dependent methyltransferase [Candidatus Magasanikbacteria bacterium]